MEKSGHPTASILVPLTSLFGDALKNYFQIYQTQWRSSSLWFPLLRDYGRYELPCMCLWEVSLQNHNHMNKHVTKHKISTRYDKKSICAYFKYMIISYVDVYEPNIQLTTKKLLHLPLLLATASYVHAVKAQHWLMNYPADH